MFGHQVNHIRTKQSNYVDRRKTKIDIIPRNKEVTFAISHKILLLSNVLMAQ